MTHPTQQCPVCFDSGSMCEHCLSNMPAAWEGALSSVPTTECPACYEFGTICRPCRKNAYEARRAVERAQGRRALRFRIWSSLTLGVAVLLLGMFLQARWDAQCAAEQPGTRWNGDLWACEVAR